MPHVNATCAFEWILGGAFLQQRTRVDHPDAPDAVCVVKPDFTPLDVSQRYIGQFTDDRSRIEGGWESSRDGHDWNFDFQLNYINTTSPT